MTLIRNLPGPLLIFFLVYYKSDKNLITAIPPLIVATLIAVSVVYFVEKKIPYVPLIGALLITIFGFSGDLSELILSGFWK